MLTTIRDVALASGLSITTVSRVLNDERCLAINLRPPYRMQVDLHNFQPAAAAMDVSMADVFQNGELLAEAMLKAGAGSATTSSF